MPRIFWRSLRSRILLLVVLTFVFLAAAAMSLFSFLRSRHAETLSLTEHHLVSVASNLARNYSDHLTTQNSLRFIQPGPPPPPPGPAAPPPPRAERAGPPHPRPDLLKQITADTLQHESGIEGGFYAAGANALVGYAFPTHEGPGAEKGMPERERPTIENLVRAAVMADEIKTSRFEGPHDAILFVALPIHEQANGARISSNKDEITGAAWLMQRIPGIEGGQSRELLYGSLGFGIAALMTALLAVFVTTEIRSGVNMVLQRLGSMEGGLPVTAPQRSDRPPLEEFDHVLRGIDSLALALREKIANERSLEAQMRHKERLSALGQFAAGIAHELRNPLGTIRLRTQMWQRSEDTTASVRNAPVILEEIDRLDRTISRLLYFSRPLEIDRQLVDLNSLCQRTAASWAEKAHHLGVDVHCHRGVNDTIVLCDASRLLQVLDNLVENAIHSVTGKLESEKLVTVSTSVEGSFATIRIEDTGAGFTPTALAHALDPFFTTKEVGTGLGLSISFEIVQAHGGELLLANREGGGAVASIHLPIVSEPDSPLEGISKIEKDHA